MYWFNPFKLITGLLPPSFLFTINIMLINWAFVNKLVPQHPSCKRFSTSIEIVAFPCIEKLMSFGSLFCFALQRNRIRYPITICKIFWSLVSFSQLPRKCTKLPASGTVGIFKFQNNFFLPIDVLLSWQLYLSFLAVPCCRYCMFWNWNHRFFAWS